MAEISPIRVLVTDVTKNVPVAVVLTHGEAQLPRYSKDGDAGADVFAVPNPDSEDGSWTIEPGQTVMVDLGLRIELPPTWEMQVRSRSGLASKGLVVANSPGTIDSGYRGPCKVLLLNTTNTRYLGETPDGKVTERTIFNIKPGERVAQFVLKRAPQAVFQLVEELSDSERGESGFGSTGT